MVEPGELVSIVGPSGCGKTTLLKLLGGLLTPQVGNIVLDGMTPHEARSDGKIGFMFQEDVLLPWRNVEQNIALPLELANARNYERRIKDLIGLVRLQGFEKNYPRELSGGMRSRVALGRAIARSPKLLMLDEPFGALDEETSRDLHIELLEVWRNETPTVLLVTHNIEHAVFVAKRVLILSKRPGTIIEDIEVDLPEPRENATRYSECFFQYVTRVRKALEKAHDT